MKRLFVAAVLFLLPGCSILNISVKARPFDNVEYAQAVNVAANATHVVHRCDNQTGPEYLEFTKALNLDSMRLVEYVRNKPDGTQALTSAEQVRKLALEGLLRGPSSLQYCIHKFSNVQASARMLAQSLSGYRSLSCFGDVRSRYVLFENSYKVGKLSQSEFKELTGDLLRLEAIDDKSCTLESRRDLEQAIEFIKMASKLISAL